MGFNGTTTNEIGLGTPAFTMGPDQICVTPDGVPIRLQEGDTLVDPGRRQFTQNLALMFGALTLRPSQPRWFGDVANEGLTACTPPEAGSPITGVKHGLGAFPSVVELGPDPIWNKYLICPNLNHIPEGFMKHFLIGYSYSDINGWLLKGLKQFMGGDGDIWRFIKDAITTAPVDLLSTVDSGGIQLALPINLSILKDIMDPPANKLFPDTNNNNPLVKSLLPVVEALAYSPKIEKILLKLFVESVEVRVTKGEIPEVTEGAEQNELSKYINALEKYKKALNKYHVSLRNAAITMSRELLLFARKAMGDKATAEGLVLQPAQRKRGILKSYLRDNFTMLTHYEQVPPTGGSPWVLNISKHGAYVCCATSELETAGYTSRPQRCNGNPTRALVAAAMDRVAVMADVVGTSVFEETSIVCSDVLSVRIDGSRVIAYVYAQDSSNTGVPLLLRIKGHRKIFDGTLLSPLLSSDDRQLQLHECVGMMLPAIMIDPVYPPMFERMTQDMQHLDCIPRLTMKDVVAVTVQDRKVYVLAAVETQDHKRLLVCGEWNQETDLKNI